jgi:hypothetical protein
MSRIKKYGTNLNLDKYSTFINDIDPNSFYLKVNEFRDVFTGGKNGFIIEGTDHLRESTDVLLEIKDVNGNNVYIELGDGIPEYYEGLSKVVSVHVYEDTPIGEANITILAELKTYVDENGIKRNVPDEWRGKYNVKWKRRFKINRNLANEDKVRFYYRPTIQIDEIVKPIFNIDVPTITQSGSVDGIAEIPNAGIFLDGYSGGTLYKLRTSSGPNWTSSIQDNIITIPSLDYSASVIEVLNERELLVDKPYTTIVGNSNVVSNFVSASYTSSFEYFENETVTNSSTLSSFGKFILRRLGTFVGDVARVKVFRKSRSLLEDFQLVQDIKLEATEFLLDYTASNATEVYYGNFYGTNFDTYWESSSIDHPISLNSSNLLNSIQIDFNPQSGSFQKVITKDDFTFTKDSEYSLSYKVLYSGSRSDTSYIKTYISSSEYLQEIGTIKYSNEYLTKTDVNINFIPISTGDGKLVFEVVGDLDSSVTIPTSWFLANVSLKASQETSFSPDEITFIQQIPRKLFNETFDFRFEFYDINNNYIPVLVERSKQFTGGNDVAGLAKQLSLTSDNIAFRFDYKNEPSPLVQNDINLTLIRQGYSGSTTFASSAFDENGALLTSASYAGGQYPGLLINVTDTSAELSITNFTGSRSDVKVSSISYTATVDGDTSSTTIFRLTDAAPPLVITVSNSNFVLPANSIGVVQSGITTSTGSVIVYSGNDLVDFEYVADVSNLSNGKFRYTVTGSGATPLQAVPTTNVYGISSISTENATLNINIDYRDPNGILTTTERVVYYAKSRINAPQVSLLSNPKAQSVSANASCVQIENFSTVTVVANEFYTGSAKPLTLVSLTSTSQSLSVAPTYNPTLGTINFGAACLATNVPSIVLNVTASVCDSEGTLRVINDNITLNKVRSGTDGDGTGVFYQGDWDNSKLFFHNCIRRDVVSYSSCYWQTNNTSLDGCCGFFWCAPSGTNTNWRSFGCTLQSVATDILFAQDVYANRTINVGTSGSLNIIAIDANFPTYCNPKIRMLATAYNTNGIFIGYDANTPKLSLKSASNCLLWDGTNLTVSGNITANSLVANACICSPNISGGTICGSTIRIGTAPNSFTADSNGIYLGSGTFSTAPFRVCMNGSLIATSATVSGNVTANSFCIDADNFWTTSGFKLNGNCGISYTTGGSIILGSNTRICGIIQATCGCIGGFEIRSDELYSNNIYMNCNGSMFATDIGSNTLKIPRFITVSQWHDFQVDSGGNTCICGCVDIDGITTLSNNVCIVSGSVSFHTLPFFGYECAKITSCGDFCTCGTILSKNTITTYNCLISCESVFVCGCLRVCRDICGGCNIWIANVGCGVNWVNYSDIRLKENISRICYGLCDVMKLKPVTYTMKNDEEKHKNIGFIAQQVKPFIPEVVTGGCILGINYPVIVSVLTNAIQQQQCQIESLTHQVNQLIGKICYGC